MVRSKSHFSASPPFHPPSRCSGGPQVTQRVAGTIAIATIVAYTVGALLAQASACAFAVSTMLTGAGAQTSTRSGGYFKIALKIDERQHNTDRRQPLP